MFKKVLEYAGEYRKTTYASMAVMLIKPLNAMLLGPRYAENLGINIRRVRNVLLLPLLPKLIITHVF